jgi:ribose transport system substrate-binding protein
VCFAGVVASAALVGSNASAAKLDAVTEAKQLVAAASRPAVYRVPGPAFQLSPEIKGKTIWHVANGLNFPFSQELVKGEKDAATAAGMKFKAVDGAGQPAKAANLIQLAISQDAAAIIVQSFASDAVSAPISDAKKAGIPVIQEFEQDPGFPSAKARALGVVAEAVSCYKCGGRALAHLVVADSGGKANVAFIDVPDIIGSLNVKAGFISEMKRLCPACKVKVAHSPVAQWGGLGTLTSSLLRDPNVNYLVPALDAMISFMKPSIYAANAEDRVRVAAYNSTLPAMQDLKKGVLMAGLVGNPPEWIGWAAVDQVLRALSGKKPVRDELIPNRTFTRANINSVDLSKPTVDWFGAADFREGYKKLWGVQ